MPDFSSVVSAAPDFANVAASAIPDDYGAGAFQQAGDVARAAGEGSPVSDMNGWDRIAQGAGDAGRAVKGGISELGGIAKTALPLVTLGATGLGVANQFAAQGQNAQMTKLAQQAAQRQAGISGQAQATAAPVQKFSADQLAAASRNELPPGEEARIQDWLNNARTQLRSKFAGKGQGDSTSLFQLDEWLNGQANMMRQAAVRDMQTTGVNAAGQAGNILGAATGAAQGSGAVAAQQQGGLEKLIAEATSQMARMGAQ